MTHALNALSAFLFEEAHLLDERRFDNWFALFEPDGYYWAPTDPATADRSQALSIYDEPIGGMEMRLNRMREITAYTERPARRTCRLIGNIVLEESDGDEVIVRSKLVLHEYRVCDFGRDEARQFAATVRHRLRRANEGYRIRWKRVDLIMSEASLPMLTAPI